MKQLFFKKSFFFEIVHITKSPVLQITILDSVSLTQGFEFDTRDGQAFHSIFSL